jgi:hypothetical protein
LLAQLQEREATTSGQNPGVKTDSVKVGAEATAQEDPQAMRERLMRMSPEERMQEFQRMRERFARMSPEEQERVRSQMRGQFGGGGGGGQRGPMVFGMGPGTDGSGGGMVRQRRASQVGNTEEVRPRIVMTKEGNGFVPRMVEVGASNFDYAEIVRGLEEGDEIQITTISRARIAAEQWNERMRSTQSMGGLGGGRVPTGSGGGGRR